MRCLRAIFSAHATRVADSADPSRFQSNAEWVFFCVERIPLLPFVGPSHPYNRYVPNISFPLPQLKNRRRGRFQTPPPVAALAALTSRCCVVGFARTRITGVAGIHRMPESDLLFRPFGQNGEFFECARRGCSRHGRRRLHAGDVGNAATGVFAAGVIAFAQTRSVVTRPAQPSRTIHFRFAAVAAFHGHGWNGCGFRHGILQNVLAYYGWNYAATAADSA